MGDTTWCELQLGGLLSKAHAQALADALHILRPYNMSRTLSSDEIFDKLCAGVNTWEFDGIDQGEIPEPLCSLLPALKLSLRWTWSEGSDYAPGIYLRDARSEEADEFSNAEGLLVLTAGELRQPGRIEAALKWDDFAKGLKLQVYTSRHELLADHRAGRLPPGYFDLLDQVCLPSVPIS